MHPIPIILIATLCSTLLALAAMALLLLLLHLLGVSVFSVAKKRRKRRARSGGSNITEDTGTDGGLPEEELLVILTAAAMEMLDDQGTGRFRVVSFRRI